MLQETHRKQLLEYKSVQNNIESDVDAHNNNGNFKAQQLLQDELGQLQFLIINRKKGQMQEINQKEREKFQSIAKLKQEMKYKITETKANLIALNEEQMETTTRLKILQNHQLTTELDN